MKKLSKGKIETKDELISDFENKSNEVERLWSEYEDAVNALNEAIADLNSTAEEINNFAIEIVTEMDEYVDEKSEKWKESDTGSAYSDWKSDWEQIEIELMDEMPVESIDLPDISAFEQVATELHE